VRYTTSTQLDFPENIWKRDKTEPSNVAKFETIIESANVESITAKARKFLQAEVRKRYQPNQKRGKFDYRKLSKVITHKSRDRPAVFKTVEQKTALDTAVYVLVDASGSMSGRSKFFLATAAGYGMARICQSFNVPCEVAAFSECGRTNNIHALLSKYGERLVQHTFIERASRMLKHMSQNADGDNILIAYHRLLERKEPKKVLIVMSDGSPCADRGDAYGFTREVIQGIEANHKVDIMGVGILDNNVTRLYTNNHVIWNTEEIPMALIEVLKANITSK